MVVFDATCYLAEPTPPLPPLPFVEPRPPPLPEEPPPSLASPVAPLATGVFASQTTADDDDDDINFDFELPSLGEAAYFAVTSSTVLSSLVDVRIGLGRVGSVLGAHMLLANPCLPP